MKLGWFCTSIGLKIYLNRSQEVLQKTADALSVPNIGHLTFGMAWIKNLQLKALNLKVSLIFEQQAKVQYQSLIFNVWNLTLLNRTEPSEFNS